MRRPPAILLSSSLTLRDPRRELSRFIAAGRLNCSIDKVNGIVETNRPDSKNAMYASVVRNGDALLNSIQKLSRVVA